MNQMLLGALQSKTMWFNLAVTALGLTGWVSDHSAVILALAPQLGPLLTIIGSAGMVLRVLTEFTPLWGQASQPPVEEHSIPPAS